MKKLPAITALLFMVILWTSCQKDDITKQWQAAIITGVDARLCPCCGGHMITLSDDPGPYQEDFYQWEKREGEFDFVETTPFPIYVKMKFDSLPDQCGRWIEVLDMKLE